jgi:tRNA nucleotidyltransferase (CCA-adding enzyme)
LQTFIDDPLRILRTIRFATRFGFAIVDEINEAISDPKIKEALAVKVSFERIGKETDLMLEGHNPADSIKLLYDYKIFSHILKFPKTCEALQNQEYVDRLTYGSYKICQVLGKLFKEIKSNPKFMGITWPEGDNLKEMQKYTFYSGILSPFKNFEYEIPKGKKSKTDKVITYVMYESLKQPNKGKNFTTDCLGNLLKFIELKNNTELDVLETGSLIRNLGELYKPTILLSIANLYFSETVSEITDEIDDSNILIYVNEFKEFYKQMKDNKVHTAHEMKPLMNGTDIMKLYNIKGGQILKKLTEEVFKWELLHPDGTLEELETYMVEHKDTFVN